MFSLIGRGKATGEIARSLGLSVNTIDSYRSQLKVKLNLSSGAELVRRAHLWVEAGRLG